MPDRAGARAPTAPIPLSLSDYLAYYSSKVDQAQQDRRLWFQFAFVFGSIFTASLIGIMTNSLPPAVSIAGLIIGILFLLGCMGVAGMCAASAYQFDQVRGQILGGALRTPEDVTRRANTLRSEIGRTRPMFALLQRFVDRQMSLAGNRSAEERGPPGEGRA